MDNRRVKLQHDHGNIIDAQYANCPQPETRNSARSGCEEHSYTLHEHCQRQAAHNSAHSGQGNPGQSRQTQLHTMCKLQAASGRRLTTKHEQDMLSSAAHGV
jgi:hypothetical protein